MIIRTAALCIILSVSAVLLQNYFAGLLCSLPVYIAARIGCTAGAVVFLSAAALSLFINTGTALFFVCTGGIVGLSSGILKSRFRSLYCIPVIPALSVLAMLFAVNYLLGVRILEASPFKGPFLQALLLFPFLYGYCLMHLKAAVFMEMLLKNIRTILPRLPGL